MRRVRRGVVTYLLSVLFALVAFHSMLDKTLHDS